MQGLEKVLLEGIVGRWKATDVFFDVTKLPPKTLFSYSDKCRLSLSYCNSIFLNIKTQWQIFPITSSSFVGVAFSCSVGIAYCVTSTLCWLAWISVQQLQHHTSLSGLRRLHEQIGRCQSSSPTAPAGYPRVWIACNIFSIYIMIMSVSVAITTARSWLRCCTRYATWVNVYRYQNVSRTKGRGRKTERAGETVEIWRRNVAFAWNMEKRDTAIMGCHVSVQCTLLSFTYEQLILIKSMLLY